MSVNADEKSVQFSKRYSRKTWLSSKLVALLLLRRQALEYIMRRASREKLANYVNYVGDTTFAMRKFTANAKQQNEIID